MKKWICTVCGYVHDGDAPPDDCPVCGADSSKFEEVKEEAQPDQSVTATGEKGEGVYGKVVNMLLKNHFHPIAVHTPNGIVPAAVLFLILAMVFNLTSFEIPAFYNFIFVLLVMPAVLFSGFVEWQEHYGGAKTSVFFTKITCGVIVFAGLIILVAWRIVDPQVTGPGSSTRWIYLLLCMAVLAAVGLAGHLGGKLVFGRKK